MTARCWAVRSRLPSLEGPAALPAPLKRHAASCLRCQAEAARYRSLRRRLADLGTVVEPAPASLADAVAAALDMPGLTEESPRTGATKTAVAAAAGAAIVAGAAVLLRRRFTNAA